MIAATVACLSAAGRATTKIAPRSGAGRPRSVRCSPARAARNGEAEAASMSCAVSALRCREDPLAILGRHAGSGVANADLYAPGCTRADFDEVGRRRARGSPISRSRSRRASPACGATHRWRRSPPPWTPRAARTASSPRAAGVRSIPARPSPPGRVSRSSPSRPRTRAPSGRRSSACVTRSVA